MRAIIALGVAAGSRIAFSQQPGKVWRIGFLTLRPRPAALDTHYYGAFLKGMRDLGYVEGKNLTMEWRFADGDLGRCPTSPRNWCG